MRQTIQRWHVGQLLMVWLVGIVVAALLYSVGGVASDIAVDRIKAAGYRDAATRALATDTLSATARADAHAVRAIPQSTSTTLPTVVGFLSWGAVLALLGGLWWATWVWFAGRARPIPPPSTG